MSLLEALKALCDFSMSFFLPTHDEFKYSQLEAGYGNKEAVEQNEADMDAHIVWVKNKHVDISHQKLQVICYYGMPGLILTDTIFLILKMFIITSSGQNKNEGKVINLP